MGLLLAAGCRTAGGPYSPRTEAQRDTAQAEQLTREAADLIYSDPEKAEELLREALTADLFHGPAHNNLGVLFLERGELYEAAGEFEWAKKLLPASPDPRMNLALTLERAGRFDEALGMYETALDVAPGHVPSMQAMASLMVRAGDDGEELARLLDVIAMRGEDEEWRAWARDASARSIE